MRAGRVLTGGERGARRGTGRVLGDARAEPERVLADARARGAQLEHDAGALAKQLVRDARAEAERLTAQAQHAASAVTPLAGQPASGTVDEVTGLVIRATVPGVALGELVRIDTRDRAPLDRKSTRLNSSHLGSSYAV